MAKFPKDAPKRCVVKTLESFGFQVVREKEHIAMARENDDGTFTPLDDAKSQADQRIDTSDHLYAGRYFALRFPQSVPVNLNRCTNGQNDATALDIGTSIRDDKSVKSHLNAIRF